jgi:hypothetical protein
MWQRGKQISRRDWTLLRVAVVACVNDVYYGRLFFGDPDTQQVQSYSPPHNPPTHTALSMSCLHRQLSLCLAQAALKHVCRNIAAAGCW